MQESKFEISASVKFPDQLESFDEKVKPSFGLSVGTAISTEWFHRLGSGTCRFYGNQLEFQKIWFQWNNLKDVIREFD